MPLVGVLDLGLDRKNLIGVALLCMDTERMLVGCSIFGDWSSLINFVGLVEPGVTMLTVRFISWLSFIVWVNVGNVRTAESFSA